MLQFGFAPFSGVMCSLSSVFMRMGLMGLLYVKVVLIESKTSLVEKVVLLISATLLEMPSIV